MAATTTTITFDFTKTNPLKRWQFNPNGATSYLFSDTTISGPTAQTVADGSLFKISRSDDQYNGLTEGTGASISLDASMNELLGISSTNTFVKRLIIVPHFKVFNNWSGMNTSALQTIGEAGRWINTNQPLSVMFKSKIRFINRSDGYYMQAWPANAGGFNISNTGWANFDTDINLLSVGYDTVESYAANTEALDYVGNSASNAIFIDDFNNYRYTSDTRIFNTGKISNSVTSSSVATQYKVLNFSPNNFDTATLEASSDFGEYWAYPLLTTDKVRFEIPFAITIPQFQHVWTDWPWNKSRKTLTTDLVFTKIEFKVMYDTISEYKAKFYAPVDPIFSANVAPGQVWLDPEKTILVPAGYLARSGKYALVNEFGVANGLRNCQAKIILTASDNGTVSSSYPTAVSGYGDYNFNPDVSYITLDAAPNYPIVFDSWEATDFDGNVTTLSYDSTINVYNGLYASIKPIFTESTPGPSPSPTPGPTPGGSCNQYMTTYAGTYTYTNCYGSSQTSYVGSGQEICAQAAPGVPAGGGFCPQP